MANRLSKNELTGRNLVPNTAEKLVFEKKNSLIHYCAR